MITKKWGQGQLFAFSALDGDSYAGDDFVGTLSGDRVGIRFHTTIRRELAIVGTSALLPEFEAVTGNCIIANTRAEEQICIVYADTHLIVGAVAGESKAVVFVEGDFEKICSDDVEIHDTKDGEYTAILRNGKKFAFAYGKSTEAVIRLVQTGISMDVQQKAEEKIACYKAVSLAEENPYAPLYSKCFSVMKTQLYSPEGNFKRIWSTPDRLPHKHLWLWDSVFHAIGHKNVHPELAENLILALFDVQGGDGFIPHMSGIDFRSGITQPPVIAWGAYKVYQKSGNREFLQTVYEQNKKFLTWCRENRRDTEEELYTWLTHDDVNCRCDESGMDNSPRFDIHARLQAIDFSCFMANEARYMQKIAEDLGNTEEASCFGDWYEEIKECINKKLWDEENGFYFDYDTTNQCLHRVMSVSSLLPLFAGICEKEQVEKLIGHLLNPEMFYTDFPIPSIAKCDKTFGSDMWRGPVWINYNYMIAEGLAEYHYRDIAKEMIQKTIDAVNRWYQCSGTLYEFYDSENQLLPAWFNRKGAPVEPYDFKAKMQSIRDYGWSCTLVFDMLHQLFANK